MINHDQVLMRVRQGIFRHEKVKRHLTIPIHDVGIVYRVILMSITL